MKHGAILGGVLPILIAMLAGCHSDPPNPTQKAIAEADAEAEALDRRVDALETEAEMFEDGDSMFDKRGGQTGSDTDRAAPTPARMADPAREPTERPVQPR